jgi:hypothetical protein
MQKPVKLPVAHFKKGAQRIDIYAKKGESATKAIQRVTSKHGVSLDKVIKRK